MSEVYFTGKNKKEPNNACKLFPTRGDDPMKKLIFSLVLIAAMIMPALSMAQGVIGGPGFTILYAGYTAGEYRIYITDGTGEFNLPISDDDEDRRDAILATALTAQAMGTSVFIEFDFTANEAVGILNISQ
jgi:hypothetical protein